MADLTKEQLAAEVQKQRLGELQKMMQQQMTVKIGNILGAVLRELAPDISFGLYCLATVLTGTAVQAKVAKEKVLQLIGDQFDAAEKELQRRQGEAEATGSEEKKLELVKP